MVQCPCWLWRQYVADFHEYLADDRCFGNIIFGLAHFTKMIGKIQKPLEPFGSGGRGYIGGYF